MPHPVEELVITVAGHHGSGRSTHARLLAESLGLRYISSGMIFRNRAEELGVTLEQMNKIASEEPDFAPPPPPPAPPPDGDDGKRKKTTMTIAIIVAVIVLLCCCCLVALIALFTSDVGQDILYELDFVMRPLLLSVV